MKKLSTASTLVAMLILLAIPRHSFAQSGTLVVYANSTQTLDQLIGGDTTSTGFQKHSIYQLVSLDTSYIFDKTITIKSSVSIVGVPDGTTGKLPTVQPDVLSDNSIPGTFFAFSGQGTRVNVENLYLEGLAINNTFGYGVGISLLADSISVTASNLVFDEFSGDAFSYQSNWDNLYITNCRMRNSINSTGDYYEGEFIRNQNGVGAFKTDSIVIKNCTLNCVAAYVCAATGGIINYFEFNHNDVINTFKNPFFIDRAVNAVIDNNIFYNAYAGGENWQEYGGWDSFTANTGPSIITFGYLDSTTAALLLGHASTGPGDPAAEQLRKVEVMNNDWYYSSGLTGFYTAWNDTARLVDTTYVVKGSQGQDSTVVVNGDSLYTPTFMNDTTVYMFNHPLLWPGFKASGNLNVDPGFGSSINASLNAGTGYAQGLLGYLTAVRNGSGTTETYGCKITDIAQPEPADWTAPWPLPEASDLAYSNTSLATGGTDGKPVGDMYWFYGLLDGVKAQPSQVPTKFALSNNYPNPFNPSTTIQVSLKQSGVMSLKIYNVLGQLVQVVEQGYKPAGVYTYNVNMDMFATGVYFYTLTQGTNVITKKMLLLK